MFYLSMILKVFMIHWHHEVTAAEIQLYNTIKDEIMDVF